MLLVVSVSISQNSKKQFFSGVGRLLPKYMKAVVMNVDEVIKKYVSEQRGTYRLPSEKTKEFLEEKKDKNEIPIQE